MSHSLFGLKNNGDSCCSGPRLNPSQALLSDTKMFCSLTDTQDWQKLKKHWKYKESIPEGTAQARTVTQNTTGQHPEMNWLRS